MTTNVIQCYKGRWTLPWGTTTVPYLTQFKVKGGHSVCFCGRTSKWFSKWIQTKRWEMPVNRAGSLRGYRLLKMRTTLANDSGREIDGGGNRRGKKAACIVSPLCIQTRRTRQPQDVTGRLIGLLFGAAAKVCVTLFMIYVLFLPQTI